MQNLSGVVDHYYFLSPLSDDVEIEEVFIVGSMVSQTNKLLLRLLLFLINYGTNLFLINCIPTIFFFSFAKEKVSIYVLTNNYYPSIFFATSL